MASNAGAAFVDLVPRVGARFGDQAASQMDGPLRGIGSKIGGLLAGAFAAAGAIGVGAFAKKAADEFRDVGGEILKVQRLTGLGAEAASKLRFAAKESGVDVGQLGTAIGVLSKHLVAGDKAADAIGVSFKDATGKARPLNDVLGDVAERFRVMPDGVEKNALAMQIFGRSGKDLIPFLNKGRDGLAELSDEAEKFGLVLTQENLDAIKKNVIGQRQLHAALSGLRVQLGQYVLPLLTKGTLLFTRLAVRGIDVVRKGVALFRRGFEDGVTEPLKGFSGLAVLVGAKFGFLYNAVRQFFDGLLHGTDELGSVQSRFAVFGSQVRGIFFAFVAAIQGRWADFAGELLGVDDRLAPIIPALTRIAQAIAGFIKGVGKLIHGDIAGWAVDVATGLGFTEDSRFTDGLIRLGNAVRSAFEWLLDHLDLLKRAGEIVAGLLVANRVAGGINDMATAVANLLPKLNPANTELGKLAETLFKIGGKAFNVTVDVAQTIGGGVADIGKSIGQAVSKAIAKSLEDEAKGAGISAGLQVLADKLGTGLAAALGAVFGPAALEAVGTFIFGTLLPAIGAALVAIASAPVLIAAAVVVAVAAAGALIYVFRKQLAEFFTKTLPDFFVNTALPAISRFFTEILPQAIGRAIAYLVAAVLILLLVLPFKMVQLFIEAIPVVVGAVVGFVVAVGTALGNGLLALVELVGTAIGAIVNFFAALPGRVVGFLQVLPGIVAGVVAAVLNFVLELPAKLPGYIEAAVSGMISFFSQLPGAVITFVGSLPGLIGGFLSNIISEILSWPVVQAIVGVLGQVVEGFREGWRQVNEITGGALNEVVGFFSGLGGRLLGAAGDLFGFLWQTFRSAINRVIGGWNSLHFGFDIPSLDLGPLGSIGGGSVQIGTPNLPYLAKGGFTLTPGLAFVDPYHELVDLPSGATVRPLNDDERSGDGWHFAEGAIQVNNPAPENASESVPRELRRLEFLLAT